MKMNVGTTLLAAALVAVGSYADIFGSGGNQFSLDFVDIGNTSVGADTTGYGAVGYNYRMGTHEVTIDQFAKARAADGRIGDGDENPYSIGVNGAASRTSWYEAAKFANYLTTGSAVSGAYQFDATGNTLLAVERDAAVTAYGTVYVLPTEDEWYKAAYLKSDGSAYTRYASGDSVPGVETDANYGGSSDGTYSTPWDVGTGGIAENNGTFDMNGNVWEWNESAYDGTLDNMSENRVFRGGAFYSSGLFYLGSSFRNSFSPSNENNDAGFRVAAIPEPSSIMLMSVAGGFALFIRRRFRR